MRGSKGRIQEARKEGREGGREEELVAPAAAAAAAATAAAAASVKEEDEEEEEEEEEEGGREGKSGKCFLERRERRARKLGVFLFPLNRPCSMSSRERMKPLML